MAVIGRMEINADAVDGACLLVVTGDVDLSKVNVFIERLFELSVNGDKKIVLDLTEVNFIDSTVINAALRAARRRSREDCHMAIVVAETVVSPPLRISAR